MGNETNPENWAARERLRWVEVTLWWRGWVGRSDLRTLFGISAAQASSDLQRYAELNPGAMTYQTSRKRYESGPRMRCVFHEPRLEEGIVFLEEEGGAAEWSSGPRRGGRGLDSGDAGRVVEIVLPVREAKKSWERRIVLAALAGEEITVRYRSLSGGGSGARVIVPRCFGSDGRRWHVRAFDRKSEEWRDFVLGRFEKVAWPVSYEGELPEDEDWEALETVQLKVNPRLSASAQEAIRMDYGLTGDALVLKVRRAMKPYLLAELFLEEGKARALPRHFVLH